MVDRIQHSKSDELIQELLRAEREAEADAARKVQLEATPDVQGLDEVDPQDDQAIDSDIATQASAQQDRGEVWTNFQAAERSEKAADSESMDEKQAEKVNVQDLLNQMAIQSGKISS